MPFLLKEADITPEIAELKSVLIVPCRFCPAASLAVQENKPYLEPFTKFLRTEAYESYIRKLKERLEQTGIRTEVFDSKLVHQFVACMWTGKRRKAFANRASNFDGVLVLGCKAAVEMMREAVGASKSRVFGGMEEEGIMNVLPKVSFPAELWLVVNGVTPVKFEREEQECYAEVGV